MAPPEQHYYSNAAGEYPGAAMSNSDLSKEVVDFRDVLEVQEVGDGAVDLRGRPSSKSRTGNWRACALIFGCEASERVGFYAISSNLVGYLTTVLHEDLSVAVRNANNWGGTARLTPIIGAIIADSYLGRFLTIGIFMSVYLLAQILVATSVIVPSLKPPECESLIVSCPLATPIQVTFSYCSFYLMTLSGGGIRACVFSFAGNQFDITDLSESKRKLSKPNWWFITITSENLVGVSCLVYAQAIVGWSWRYGIPALVTAVWAIVFLRSAGLYRNQRVSGSPITRVAQVFVAAMSNWRVTMADHPALQYELDAANLYD